MKIAVIGSGYVGLVTAACLADMGHNVVCIDNDRSKLDRLRAGIIPIHENLLPELIKRHSGHRMVFSDSIAEGIQGAEAVFITVGTPTAENGEADLSYIDAVAREIAVSLDGRKVIIEKSTVPARTAHGLRQVMEMNGASPNSFVVASNPEFLREGTAVSDFLYPDRIVIGVGDAFAEETMRRIYEPLTSGAYYKSEDAIPGRNQTSAKLIVTDTTSSELIKHASNAFLAMKISFINAIATIAEGVGADIDNVAEGVGSDTRIGHGFLKAGIGFGGSCFPKDVRAFRAVAQQIGYDFTLLTEVTRINQMQRDHFLALARKALWTLRGKKIAVLGIAFKGGTDDIRESPAVDIIERLLEQGAEVTAFDPAAMDNARAHFPADSRIKYATDSYAACEGADALFILTEWQEFGQLDLEKVRKLVRIPLIVDGRNLFDPEDVRQAGFGYYSIGRASVPVATTETAAGLR